MQMFGADVSRSLGNDNKINVAISKSSCHEVSQEIIFLSAPMPDPLKNINYNFCCRLAVSDSERIFVRTFLRILVSVDFLGHFTTKRTENLHKTLPPNIHTNNPIPRLFSTKSHETLSDTALVVMWGSSAVGWLSKDEAI